MTRRLLALSTLAALLTGCGGSQVAINGPFPLGGIRSSLVATVQDEDDDEIQRAWMLLAGARTECSEFIEQLDASSVDDLLWDHHQDRGALLLLLERNQMTGWEGLFTGDGIRYVDEQTLGYRQIDAWLLAQDAQLQQVTDEHSWLQLDRFIPDREVQGSFQLGLVDGTFDATDCGLATEGSLFPL